MLNMIILATPIIIPLVVGPKARMFEKDDFCSVPTVVCRKIFAKTTQTFFAENFTQGVTFFPPAPLSC